MNQNVKVRYATIEDVSYIAPLLDLYRQFYGEQSKLKEAEKFLKQRFLLGESQIIIATIDNTVIGFTQLFPSFSSVTMQRLWILNDLYVATNYRGKVLLGNYYKQQLI